MNELLFLIRLVKAALRVAVLGAKKRVEKVFFLFYCITKTKTVLPDRGFKDIKCGISSSKIPTEILLPKLVKALNFHFDHYHIISFGVEICVKLTLLDTGVEPRDTN